MSQNLCVRCGRPMADQAYTCGPCAESLADALREAAGHAEDAETVIARQARYGGGSRGGSSDGLTFDATKSAKFARVRNTIGTWVDVVCEESGTAIPAWHPLAGPLCPPTGTRCRHGSCAALRQDHRPAGLARDAAWLAGQVGWLRKRQLADQAFGELEDACEELRRLVDRPADKELVGMCDCGKVLYAPHGKAAVTCPAPTCRLRWNVAESRGILRRSLDGKLVTASEAARLAAFLDTDRNQQQIRKLINRWATRGELLAHPLVDEVAFRFGDIVERLARAPRRATREAA